MFYDDDDIKYRELIKSLKTMDKVKAKSHFEADLMRRINSEDYQKEERSSGYFRISRIIPASALTAVLVIFFLIFNSSPRESENPLLTQPRLRDGIAGSSGPELIIMQTEKPKTVKRSDLLRGSTSLIPASLVSSSVYKLTKSGLNFKQINLTKEERQQINKLKEKVRNLISRTRQ